MPSQNLPKPNIPSQPTVVKASNQVVFDQKPNQLRQAQAVPGGLSRENPGGTPPNMRVAAPTAPVPPASAQSPKPEESKPLSPKPQAPASMPTSPSPARPASPLGQVSRPVASVVEPSTNFAESPNFSAKDKPSSSAPSQPARSSQSSQSSQSGDPVKAKNKFLLPLLIGGGALLLILLAVLAFNLFSSKSTSTNSTTSKSGSTNTGNKSTSTGNNGSATGSTSQTTLTYWGLWEDSQVLKDVIADFESKNPSIKIDYRKQSHRDYRERLQQAIASGNGPDIFRYHVDWVPMLSADLATMPSSVMSAAEFKQIFYPTAFNNLQVGGQIVGIPLMYDGLGLFYNKEMLKTANVDVPTTWAELRIAANKLTVPTNSADRQSNNITRAGLAIGNAGNVDHFSDILALLIIQNGGSPGDAKSQYVQDALTFYTNFIKQDKVWSDRLANSTTAFARGDVAMILAPSWRIHDIKNLNPNLDFAVARVPQLDSEKPATWASFWVEGVSAKSKSKEAAWAFLKYLSTPEVLRKFYNSASQYRAFGEIYPRADMASELQSSSLLGSFVADAAIAKTWSMASFTHDNGLNDQIIKYYEDAVNAVLSGEGAAKALETTATGVTSVLGKYTTK